MKWEGAKKNLRWFAVAFGLLVFAACSTTGGGIGFEWGGESAGTQPHGVKQAPKDAPPPHAPAHGYRAKYRYRYYPSNYVYFDVNRQLYFYLQGEQWRMASTLPGGLHLRLNDYVRIEMGTDRPYTEFSKHKDKYPPGQFKKDKGKKYARF